MHVEDMQQRRGLRMLLVRFDPDTEPEYPGELELSVRERSADGVLLEHRGELAPLLKWLAEAPVRDVRIGTEDLRTLYDEFHGPNVKDEEDLAE